jgi:hypothetical protein
MSEYKYIAMRPNLTSPRGVVPSTGCVTCCPDIIPNGTDPITDFKTALATEASFNSNPGKDILIHQQNLIYVRGQNFKNGAETGQIYLYYVPCAVINWPSEWANNKLAVNVDSDPSKLIYYASVSASENGQVVVGDKPFLWNADSPPAGSSHFCLISQVVTPDNLNPIPGQSTPMTYEDMANLVRNNLGFGWRNVTEVNSGATWTYQTMLTVPDNIGSAESVHIYLACHNMPIGSDMAFTCSTNEKTSGPISIPRTTITDPNQIAGVTVTLQPGFCGSIGVTYWANGKKAQSGSNIALEASIEPDGGAKGFMGSKFYDEDHINRFKQTVCNITPTAPVYLGEYKYVTK